MDKGTGIIKSQEVEMANWSIKRLQEKIAQLYEDVDFWKDESERANKECAMLNSELEAANTQLEAVKAFAKKAEEVNDTLQKEIAVLKLRCGISDAKAAKK